jgi:septum formation protein
MHLTKPLVLASQSPRRIDLLKQIGLNPIVLPSHIPEEFDPRCSPIENARTLALEKAKEVACQVDDAIIVGADTIVVLDGMLLGKPQDEDDARRMLRLLSGRTHTVVTGFALIDCLSGRSFIEHEETQVTFRVLPETEIEEYILSGSPMDKAGAYGIQDDYGAVFVVRIEGCFYNVVGFPLSKFYASLQKFHTHLVEGKGLMYVEEN